MKRSHAAQMRRLARSSKRLVREVHGLKTDLDRNAAVRPEGRDLLTLIRAAADRVFAQFGGNVE